MRRVTCERFKKNERGEIQIGGHSYNRSLCARARIPQILARYNFYVLYSNDKNWALSCQLSILETRCVDTPPADEPARIVLLQHYSTVPRSTAAPLLSLSYFRSTIVIVSMSAPSTPNRGTTQPDAEAHRRIAILRNVFSPVTANQLSKQAKATIMPPLELIEQCIDMPPTTMESWLARLAPKLTVYENEMGKANDSIYSLEILRTAWTEKKQGLLKQVDECDEKIAEITKKMTKALTDKECNKSKLDEDGKLVHTMQYLLDPNAPKEYVSKPIPVIREELSLLHQDTLPDEVKALKRILYRLWYLGLFNNVDFVGSNADASIGFNGLVLTSNASKFVLKQRIIQYLQIPPAPAASESAISTSSNRASVAVGRSSRGSVADALVAVDPPSVAEQRASLQAQMAVIQAQLAEIDAAEPGSGQFPAAHMPADDENEYGSKQPSTKKRRYSENA